MTRDGQGGVRGRTAKFGILAAMLLAAGTPAWALTITVDSWGNFTATQQSRTQDAIDDWEALLPDKGGNVHITFNFEDLGAKGAIPPDAEATVADVVGKDGTVERLILGVTDTWAYDGDDRPSGARIRMTSHATIDWYMGTGAVPGDEMDWYSVMIHELCHAVGFTVNCPRFSRNVTAGPGSNRTYNSGGSPTALLVPSAEGTHLDAATYPGFLMVPSIGYGTRRSPSSLEEDLLEHDVWAYPLADLRVSAASASVVGTTVNISATVRNDGAGSSGYTYLGYYLSSNTTITTNDYFLGSDYVAALGPSGTSAEGLNVDVLAVIPSLPAATYYIGLIADYTGREPESDEADNDTYIASPTVTVPPTDAPTGLVASDGNSLYPGYIHISWGTVSGATHYRLYENTVNNSGSATAVTGWQTATVFDRSHQPGQVYWYWVKAAASSGGLRESAFSTPDSGSVDAPTLSEDGAVTTTNEPAYYEFLNTSGYWSVVGVRYNDAGENWSLKLYSDDSFTNLVEQSAYSYDVDFIVVDGNHAASQYRGVEAYRVSGTHDATVEFEGGANVLAVGTNGAFSWPSGDVVEIWDLPLSNGTYRIDLTFVSGAADLDIALFSSQDGDYFRSRGGYLGRSILEGGGLNESFYATVSATDDYGLCVWANDTNTASYRITISRTTAGLWEGDVSRNWHTPGNWNDNAVPAANDDVTIPAGTTYSPLVSAGAASCSNLTVQSGATLTVTNQTLTVAGDLSVYGNVTVSYLTSGKIVVNGTVRWQSGSTASIRTSSIMQVYGDWYFYDGANVQLTSGYVDFVGAGTSYIRCYEENCRFFRIQNHKESPGYLLFSTVSTAPLKTYYFYTYADSVFYHNSDQDLILSGSWYNSDGHFYGTGGGALVYDGSPATYDLRPSVGDYVHNLRISSSSPVTMDMLYTNTLVVKGDLIIESGGLAGSGMNIEVGGNWSNTVGAGGYVPGTGVVSFVGTGSSAQNIDGSNIFYAIREEGAGSGALCVRGAVTVSNDYTCTTSNVVYGTLDVKGELDISAEGCGFTVKDGADVHVARLDLYHLGTGGSFIMDGGAFVADDVLDAGLYGNVVVNGGQADLHLKTYSYLDLRGDLTVRGGALNIRGGSSASYWPFNHDASVTMSGGVIDMMNTGIRVDSNAYAFIENITGGTIRSAVGFACERADFTPAGGVLELCGTNAGVVNMVAGSSLHDLLVNKSGTTVTVASASLDVDGDFLLRGGTFVAPTNMVVGRDWSNGVGRAAFVEGTGTLTFAGADSARLRTGETFYDLRMNKTYPQFEGLVVLTGLELDVSRNLWIADGTLEMDWNSVLRVSGDVTIYNGAGLNINDGNVSVFIGDDFADNNLTRSTTNGLMPGNNCTVTFNGTGAQGLTAAASGEEFVNLTIDKPAGDFSPNKSLAVYGALRVLSGEWSSGYVAGLTHKVGGNVEIAAAGLWSDVTGTLVFNGPTNVQSYACGNRPTRHGIIRVDKNPGEPVVLLTPLITGAGCDVVVNQGVLDLNGEQLTSGGDVIVNSNGVIQVDSGASLKVAAGYGLTVNAGGELMAAGSTVSPATVTRSGAGYYSFGVESGGTLSALNTVFEYMDLHGVNIKTGAVVAAGGPLDGCTFRNGQSNGVLVTVDNAQTFTAKRAVFPTNAGGDSRNVRKNGNSGRVSFVAASGAFAGETYDYDPYDRVDWHSGVLSGLSVSGPPIATRGADYVFRADATGDMVLTPISYRWDVTDLAPFTGSASTTTVTRSIGWNASGAKTVQVTASNAVSGTSGSWPVSVQDLTLAAGQFVPVTATSNRVVLTISGTSSQSLYQVQFKTNGWNGVWQAAAPLGTTVPGADGSLVWTDYGASNRNLRTCSNVFYRAILLTP